MKYYLIKGRFRVVGYSPDGDSLMFEANNKKHWNKVTTANREAFDEKLIKGKGIVQLRLQGIDALETHYSPSPFSVPADVKSKTYSKAIKPKMGKFRQPEKFGELATVKLLEQFGVTDLKWKNSGWGGSYVSEISVKKGKKTLTHKKKNTDPLEGYIVVNDMDRKGRPICWVFGGSTRKKDGSALTNSALGKTLKSSANRILLEHGLVYPYYFYTLSSSLRDILVPAVNNAQTKKLGVWSEDKTAKGITLRSASKLTKDHLILPYLFRRIIKHQYRRMNEGYYEAIRKKKKFTPNTRSLYLDTFWDNTNPYIFRLDKNDFVRMDQIIKVTKTKIVMTVDPGKIIFLS